jgi:membrane-bound lytic murein transglycosylase
METWNCIFQSIFYSSQEHNQVKHLKATGSLVDLLHTYKLDQEICRNKDSVLLKAVEIRTGFPYHVKKYEDAFRKPRKALKMLREISIMRQLSQMEDNEYTVKLLGVYCDVSRYNKN